MLCYILLSPSEMVIHRKAHSRNFVLGRQTCRLGRMGESTMIINKIECARKKWRRKELLAVILFHFEIAHRFSAIFNVECYRGNKGLSFSSITHKMQLGKFRSLALDISEKLFVLPPTAAAASCIICIHIFFSSIRLTRSYDFHRI